MQDLLDDSGEPMLEDERAFWEDVAACVISSTPAVAQTSPAEGTQLIRTAFAWADKTLEVYRGRLRDRPTDDKEQTV